MDEVDNDMMGYEERLQDRVNRTIVSREEILEVVEKVQALKRSEVSFEARVIVIFELHPGDSDKCEALMFRLEALASLISNQGASAWTLPMANGAIMTEGSVFAAAAVVPLVKRNEKLEFDREEFFKKAFELMEPDVVG